eukprot:4438846-Pyramimonas_sp.AAC.1
MLPLLGLALGVAFLAGLHLGPRLLRRSEGSTTLDDTDIGPLEDIHFSDDDCFGLELGQSANLYCDDPPHGPGCASLGAGASARLRQTTTAGSPHLARSSGMGTRAS